MKVNNPVAFLNLLSAKTSKVSEQQPQRAAKGEEFANVARLHLAFSLLLMIKRSVTKEKNQAEIDVLIPEGCEFLAANPPGKAAAPRQPSATGRRERRTTSWNKHRHLASQFLDYFSYTPHPGYTAVGNLISWSAPSPAQNFARYLPRLRLLQTTMHWNDYGI